MPPTFLGFGMYMYMYAYDSDRSNDLSVYALSFM